MKQTTLFLLKNLFQKLYTGMDASVGDFAIQHHIKRVYRPLRIVELDENAFFL